MGPRTRGTEFTAPRMAEEAQMAAKEPPAYRAMELLFSVCSHCTAFVHNEGEQSPSVPHQQLAEHRARHNEGGAHLLLEGLDDLLGVEGRGRLGLSSALLGHGNDLHTLRI